ncbi:MAG: hypothetical protein UR28_C0026G0007 [Candidatus Peregrinibacteria bacterium GW2011_GWF2_33_10]|nr:MAG: hypothetical protein UR28_C0026G0007 [Candidatus Peregrinibacteria bacterium GW2011_GWF2_33_10]OGJ50062.1 MAG: hypothetical protein A2307_01520 [Candidatus Peregrinibacteria bacterium RIFOXYB2_FULL_33_20]
MSSNQINEQGLESNQLREKFFFHWAILAAGTFSLLIPFVQSLENIVSPKLFIAVEILLILSIISSSLRNFFWAKTTWYWAEINAGITKNKKLKDKYHKFALSLEFFSIIFYIVGIFLGLVFVNLNILC